MTEKVPVAAIDGHLNIYFNPLKIQKIIESTNQMEALQQIGFLWIHEISHILREHNQRAAEGAVDPNIWNIAADMEINDSDWEGLEPPALYPGIYPNTFKMNAGELAETYYKKLTEKSEQDISKGLAKAMDKILADQEKEKEEKKETGDSQEEPDVETAPPESEEEQGDGEPKEEEDSEESENGDGQGAGNDSSKKEKDETDNPQNQSDDDPQNSEENTDDSEEGEGLDQENGNPEQDDTNPEGSGENKDAEHSETEQEQADNGEPTKDPNASYHELLDEGSGVHNIPRPWEMDAGPGEAQELDEIETEQVRIAVAKEMSEAAKAGLIPAGWERWVGKKLRPMVDWRKVLRHRVSRAINHSVGARIDYSFARPSRRQSVYQPLIPPALSGNLTGQIACVVDTSGSIGDAQLTRILSEVCGILEVFNTPVTIIPCDAKAYDPVLLTRNTDLQEIISMPGGGGTNMIRGIEAALALKPVPDVVVVLTDGYTPYPKKLYKMPVLFGIITNDLERTSMLPGSPWRDDLVIKILME